MRQQKNTNAGKREQFVGFVFPRIIKYILGNAGKREQFVGFVFPRIIKYILGKLLQ